MKTMVHGIMRDLEAEKIAYDKKCNAIARAVAGARAHQIGRVCARFELESDEFYTAEQKAVAMIKRNPNL